MDKLNKSIKTLVTVVVLIVGVIFYINDNQDVVYKENDYDIRCIDGDTFALDGVKIRLLVVDAPEYTTQKEEFGKEASDFTCESLKTASSIRLSSDSGNEEDQYNRKLYWVYVDDMLLQELLVEQGLAKVKYIDKNTVNTKIITALKLSESRAKKNKLNIWK